MPQLDSNSLYKSIEASLDKQSFHPIYLFYGDEPYLINQAVGYLKTCALHGGPTDFTFASFYAGDADLNQIRDEVETLPFMAFRRVVLLKEIQVFTDKDWNILLPIIENPVESTVLILTGLKVDKRKKFFKILNEQAYHVEFRRPYENQIPTWIKHICKGYNLTIQNEAVELFHRRVGNQLTDIDSEIKKLQSFLGGTKTIISYEDVAQCVSKVREENVFQLAEKIALGEQVQSLILLAQLLDQGQSEVAIVSLIARHMRILLLIKQGMESGLSGQRLAQYAQIPNYFIQDYIKQSRLWSAKKIEDALIVLAETDRALKSSPLSAHIWLENLIFKTCIPSQGPDQIKREVLNI